MGLSPLALRVVARRENSSAIGTIRPCRNAEPDVFQSFRTTLRRGGAHTRHLADSECGQAKRLLKSSAEPVKHFIIFCRNNRDRCPYLSESRSTTAVRSTSNIGACPVVPPTRAVTEKVNRLLTLSRVCSGELDFRTTEYLSATNSTRPAAHRWNTPDPSFR